MKTCIFQPVPSPISSPQKDKYGDRFIPSRSGAVWHINFNLTPESKAPAVSSSPSQTRGGTTGNANNGNNRGGEANTDSAKDGMAYNCLLKNELLGAGIEDLKVYYHGANLCSLGNKCTSIFKSLKYASFQKRAYSTFTIFMQWYMN